MPRTTSASNVIDFPAETKAALSCREREEYQLQINSYERAKTLFFPNPFGKPTENYDYLFRPVDAEHGIIWKPKETEGDYTQHRYLYWYKEQTCSCPFFCGIDPRVWSDTFQVRREGKRVVVTDRHGEVVPPQKPGHGYCKHTLGFLYYLAMVKQLPPSKPSS